MFSWAGILVDSRLDFKSRGEPTGKVGAVAGRVAAGVHIAEVVAVVVIWGTLPPNSSGTGRTVLVLHLRVSRRIIGILCLIVLFRTVCVGSCAPGKVLGAPTI